MEMTIIGGGFAIFMQTLSLLFLIYGAVLAVASVLPERWLRRFERKTPRAEAPREGVRSDQVVPNA